MTALATAREYHEAWTAKDFDRAVSLLASDLDVEVPINAYPTTESFAAALRGFGSLVRETRVITALGGDSDAILLYDMDVDGLGTMRIAEHFEVADGRIVTLRQIHDTVALRG